MPHSGEGSCHCQVQFLGGIVLSSESLSAARALFPHTAQGRIYLNHAGTSPLSRKVVEPITVSRTTLIPSSDTPPTK